MCPRSWRVGKKRVTSRHCDRAVMDEGRPRLPERDADFDEIHLLPSTMKSIKAITR